MNAARLGVGVQGVAVAERATQRAIAYAQERKQGPALTAPGAGSVAIIQHADVRRNLLTMQALTQASRCICLATARNIDEQQRSSDEAQRTAAGHRAALLTPIAKAFSTDMACEVASLGVQVHGGMGFIEETGAAQHFRDARILPIYEGTNGIQAIDLVGRKLSLEGGEIVNAYMRELDETAAEVSASNVPEFGKMGERLAEANAALRQATEWLLNTLTANPETALTGATPYLRLFGLTAGGAYLAREALAANRSSANDGGQQIARARFFAENLIVTVPGLAQSVMAGADAVLSVTPEALAG
jgi:acyl-CoA dehydrogenase